MINIGQHLVSISTLPHLILKAFLIRRIFQYVYFTEKGNVMW